MCYNKCSKVEASSAPFLCNKCHWFQASVAATLCSCKCRRVKALPKIPPPPPKKPVEYPPGYLPDHPTMPGAPLPPHLRPPPPPKDPVTGRVSSVAA
eukprot:1143517-Pelagomonas_calceolata.AAC.19